MAGSADKPANREPGAPIPKDEIDPELVKLSRPRPKVGIITAAGVVFLSLFFGSKILPDWAFSREDAPASVALADVLAGKVADERFIEVPADPVMAHAIRVVNNPGDMGLRVTPARGTSERLWIVLGGDGWDRPVTESCKKVGAAGGAAPRNDPGKRCYTGRLRRLADVKFSGVLQDHARKHPRAVFARPADVRAGFATGTVASVTGDQIKLADADRIVFELVDPAQSTIIASFVAGTPDHPPLLDGQAWTRHLTQIGFTISPAGESDPRSVSLRQVRFSTPLGVAEVTKKLEDAKLWAARVEPVTIRRETTWGALRTSGAGAFTVDGTTIPDAQVDLVGLQLSRPIPSDAYALITNDRPADYWYVTPVLVLVVAIVLVFAWALIRAIRRDLLPARVPASAPGATS